MEKKIQLIHPDVDDDVSYNLRGNIIPVVDLTDTQLEIGYWRTLEKLGKIAGQMKDLYIKHQAELKVLNAISLAGEERGLPAGHQTTVTIKEYA